ncbi:hypothetical protein [Mesorhizobium sp. B2-1-2]|uniref:hypothetical protein n=1 Tax=Mesorhizobium sp. B2-1-2 TaxID=2589973 RepID=UPI0011275D1C|nr:hypothetical protein [Mesorhizobium sp. B2-1-2]TPN04538.1 hypothetical protein FJ971_29800 [Mesorhizobium sp. B2-1-2]
MTAINVFIDHNASHLFADTGHYNNATGQLDHLADKVFPLPEQQALLAWSGPSALGPRIADLLRRSGARSIQDLVAIAPGLIANLRLLAGFSAIVVGAGQGIAIEEGGRVHHLTPGSVIRTISAANQLDPDDLQASAVRLMEEQRQSSGVVFGRCQHWLIRPTHCQMQVLHDWNDRPALIKGASSLAAKIQDLTVDKINIAPNAVTKLAAGTTTIVSGSDGSYPNIIWVVADCTYNGTAGGSAGFVRVTLRRTGSIVVGQVVYGWSGVGFQNALVKLSTVDIGMAANQSYTVDTPIYTSTGLNNSSMVLNSITSELFYTAK